MEPEPTVFVVDDDADVLEAVGFLLHSVGLKAETYASAKEFLEAYDQTKPGCLVLDVRMPGMSGLELQERLHALESTLPIIFLSAHGDVPIAVHAIKAGAVDFLEKPFRDQELIDKVQHAIEANVRLRKELAERNRIAARIDTLTQREREVMELVVQGKTNKAIASELGLSQRTVEIHRARVMRKMQADSVSELVQMVMRFGA
ncbi:MAG: response regulator transcription factor [Gemmatimonadota bacterium]|nr:MAG: response regulator transcription factor [Gemmatimonadota bacterium]